MAGGALRKGSGGTAGHRVGRGRGCRSGVVERHAVELVLLWWGPLNGTTIRCVPAPGGVYHVAWRGVVPARLGSASRGSLVLYLIAICWDTGSLLRLGVGGGWRPWTGEAARQVVARPGVFLGGLGRQGSLRRWFQHKGEGSMAGGAAPLVVLSPHSGAVASRPVAAAGLPRGGLLVQRTVELVSLFLERHVPSVGG